MWIEKLYFKLGLQDDVTGPIGKVQKELDGLASHARKSFLQIGTGGVGMWGAAQGIDAMLTPARDMNRALAEVSSLGVDDAALNKLNNSALDFSIAYGMAADSVAASAYDIQSSISGLTGNELASFTKASNVLAKATKADAATITAYTGTMYGIFKKQADEVGKATWVEQLAGKTATAVQMFKTTGMEMSAAFTAIGANATAAGIDVSEQMAVMGTLQATMSGSEAGTKYKAFLSGIGGAQEKLGLQFTDSDGNMLGMVEILSKLKDKFGDTFDVAESDMLKSAFGSDEAVSLIKLLMADTEGLGKSIDALGNVNGMGKAEAMARKMVDPFDRLSAGSKALSIVVGQALLPSINPLVDMFADGAATMAQWADEYPNLTRWVGYGAMAVLGFAGVLGLAAAASGFMRIATFGLSAVMAPVRAMLLVTNGAWTAYSGVQWLANAALWGFPATWIVAALIGVVAAVGAVIYWWDDLKAAFVDSGWWDTLVSIFDFEKLFSPLSALFTFFSEGFDGVFTSIMNWFDGLGGAVGWLIDKLNLLPGVEISTSQPDVSVVSSVNSPSQVAMPHTSPSLEAPRKANIPVGGVSQQISNAMTKNQSQSQSIGKVVITTEGRQDAQSIRDELLMVGA